MRSQSLEHFAKILPYLIIIASIFGLLIGGLILGRWDYSMRGLIIAVPSIIASIFLLYAYKHQSINQNEKSIVLFKMNFHLYLTFALLYFISIIMLLTTTPRFLYLLLIAALYFTILIQIFSKKISSNKIIFEIVSILINIIYGTTLIYPLFFRTTDILIHNILSNITLLSAHIIPVDLDVSYATFPLFHIFNAVSSNILGLSSQNAHFIIMCLVYVIAVFFLYKIFLIVSKNEQISLLACLCFSIFQIVLLEGMMTVTRTTAFIGFVILLYLVFTAKERNSRIFSYLIFLFMIFIILVHQVSVAQIALLITLLIVCEFILNEKRYFSNYQMLFLIISFLSYWFFVSQLFTNQLIRGRTNLEYFDVGEKYTVLLDPSLDQMQVAISFVQNQIDMGIFIFFAIIGIGYILYRRKPQYLSVIAIFSLIAFIFYVPNPLFTSQTITKFYRIDRFWILLSPFMAFIMAYGIFGFSKWILAKQKFSYLLIIFVFTLFILLSLINPIMNSTSKEERLYFTNGELNGFSFITRKIPYGSGLYSDEQTARFYHLDYFSLTDVLKLPYYTSYTLSDMKWSPKDDQYVIFRNLKFNDGRIQFQGKEGFVQYVSNEENIRDVERFCIVNNNIYSNDQISIIIGKF